MSDELPSAAAGDESEESPDKPTIAPFVGALVVVVLVVIGIFAIDSFGGDELTPEQLVSRAVIGQNDALQREDYGAYRNYTCQAAQGDEAGVIAGQKESVAKDGARYVDDVTAVRIDGDEAVATVTYSFNNARDDKSSTDVRLIGEDGAWKVCPSP